MLPQDSATRIRSPHLVKSGPGEAASGRRMRRSFPVQAPQQLGLRALGGLSRLRARKQEVDGLSGLAKVVKAIRTPALHVLIDLASLLRLQQAKQEQLINVI